MRTLIIVLAAAAAALAQDTVRHAHDVRALTGSIPAFRGPDVGFPAAETDESRYLDDEEVPMLSGEDLRLLVTATVAPGTWDAPPHALEFNDGRLIVTHTKKAQEEVQALLAALRTRLFRIVVVDAEVLEVAPGVLDAAAGAVLTAEQEKALEAAAADPARGRRAAILRTVGLNRQRVHSTALAAQSFVRDYDVEIANYKAIADPIVDLARDGYVLEVRPAVAPDNASVFLEVRFAGADASAVRIFEPGTALLGVVEEPEKAVAQTRTSLYVPAGRSVLLSASSFSRRPQPGWSTVVVIRAGVQADALPAEKPGTEKRTARLFDVGAVLAQPRDFPGPALGALRLGASEGPVGATFVESADSGLAIGPEALVEMIRANVAAGSWNDPANSLTVTESATLVAVNSPEVLQALDAFLTKLAESRARLVAVETWLVSMDEAAWRTHRAALSGAEVPAETWKAILADAAAGETARLLGSVRALGQNGTRFHAARGAVRPLILDYDVEIARGVSAHDPVVSEVAEGLALDVTPIAIGDGRQIQADLRPAAVIVTEPQARPMSEKGPKVQTADVSDFSVKTQMLLNAGAPTLVGQTTRSEGGKREVLLFFVRAAVVGTK